MHRTPLFQGWRSLFIGVATSALIGGMLLAQSQPAAPQPAAPAGPTTPATAPSTQPSQLLLGGGKGPLPLDPRPFERQAAGISFRSPLGWNGLVQADRDEIVRYVSDLKKQDWTLSVTRRSFPKPQALMAMRDAKGELIPGIMENTLAALERELPGAKVLRSGDPTNIGALDVGMIVLRYTKNGERRLAQHAVIQANNQLFYLLAFNSPGRKDVAEDKNAEEKTVDPTEQQAIETFRSVLDSVKLLDLQPVRDDQVNRLFRTRSLIFNFTEKKLTGALVGERYLRIIKDGKDVGYSYVKEEATRRGGADGIYVGIHTRVMTLKDGKVLPFPREDSESQMFVSNDRRNESWSKISAWDDDGRPKTPSNPWKKVSEFGATARTEKKVLNADSYDPRRPGAQVQRGEIGDSAQPWVDTRESYSLNVQFKGTRGDLEPVVRMLPPFYLPQALGSLLPRLVPPREPKGYLFASYVSELRQVALRYVDVRPEEALPRELVMATGLTRGVPIDDRIGYEGAITTHYVTVKGDYLGSVTKTKDSHLVVVPTDAKALLELWHVEKTPDLFVLPPSVDEMGPANPAGNALVNPTRPNGNR
jgi:hypothetical protein